MKGSTIDINARAFKKLDLRRYEGKCVGLANGKVVIKDKSITVVMHELFSKYKGQPISVMNVPQKNTVFVL